MSELFPSALSSQHAKLYISEFTHAYELQLSAEGMTLCRNRQRDNSALSPEQIAGRTQIIDIAIKLILAERDRILDEFCAAWIKMRSTSEGS